MRPRKEDKGTFRVKCGRLYWRGVLPFKDPETRELVWRPVERSCRTIDMGMAKTYRDAVIKQAYDELVKRKVHTKSPPGSAKAKRKKKEKEGESLKGHKYYPHLLNPKKNAIYVLDYEGITKIGYTTYPVWTRMKQHKSSNPCEFALSAIMPGTEKREKQLHKYFEPFMKAGQTEWFRFTKEARDELLGIVKKSWGVILDPPIIY